jgi:hypothetical protein
MTTTGLLDLGVAEVADRRTGELLGYVFTEASGKGQLQRWLLFRHPQNEFEVRLPPASANMTNWSLAEWQARVPSLWQPNGYYVWAQADVYRHGETYDGVTWTEVPKAASLPSPTFPERPGSKYQLDYLEGKLIDVRQGDWLGRAYVVRGLTVESGIEYWSLPAQYQAAGSARTSVAVGAGEATSLDAFVDITNRTWAAGCTFLITGCLNYHGTAAPFSP